MESRNELERQMLLHLQTLINEKKITGAEFEVSCMGERIARGKLGISDYYVDIQSITKMFTAVAILQLHEQGELRLDDFVAKFIPEFQRQSFSEITVLQLLTHTSGLAALQDAFPERNMDWEAELSSGAKGKWIPAILHQGLFYQPGTKWEYSKAGFCILGELIQRITGLAAEEYIQKHILLPCGMKESHWRMQDDGIRDIVPQTAAGLFVPIGELVQFGMMLAQGGVYEGRRILEEASIQKMEQNQLPDGMRDFCWDHAGRVVTYGAGCPIFVNEEPQWTVGERSIYHEGAGASMLFVNRKECLSAAWNTPFYDKNMWCDEAVKGTAAVMWKYYKSQ